MLTLISRGGSLKITLGFLLVGLAACTKELPYEEQFKPDELLQKSVIDTQGEYLMSSSMLNASRSSQDALPFAAGDNKRVRLVFEENALAVYELDRDKRFQENSANNKLVMEIPIEHKDFQCAKDKYGDCTNTEEEKSDVKWNQKSQFVLKPEAAKSARLEVLPILLDMKLGMGFCYAEIRSRVAALKIDKESLNMSIERTFNVNPFCVDIQELSDTTVTAVFHYSFVKTSAILSPDFKTKNYPRIDENTFGFFSTQRQELDSDNNATTRGEVSIMNHWNPNRKEINYFLTDNFFKPENKKILESTKQVFDSLNVGLKNAGAQFQLKLNDERGKMPGDIRNSMIILVEDPIAASIIGYGPQVEDPVTGEIVSARTVMFLGTIKTFVQHTYADILREKKRAQQLALNPQPVDAPSVDEDPNGGLIIENALQVKLPGSVYLGRARSDMSQVPSLSKIKQSAKPLPTGGNVAIDPIKMAKVAAIQKDLKTNKKALVYKGDVQAHLKYLTEAKNCAFGLGAETLSAISPKLMAAIPDDAKPWEQLKEEEKQALIDLILPEIWIPTLIHEMGHNLGLRHNFAGSEDIANFYSQEELQQLGLENTIPSSSVMEYIDDLKALPVLGKYDIAALRFAYAGKIQMADGRELPVEGTIKETLEAAANRKESAELKDYKFCTDENTGINANCRRFDLGITYTDMIVNAINEYENRYEIANRRAGRASFSLFDDPGYLARTRARFESMRLTQEVYSRIKSDFGLEDSDPVWEEVPFAKDLKQASQLTARFLMNVLATPDLTCVLTHASVQGQVADIQRLDNIDKNEISCFALNAGFEERGSPWRVIGQFGKSFQSKKDPNSDNAYADQIDVRGVWMDKLAAAQVLFKRDLGISSLDENTDNFTDRADLVSELLGLTQGTVLNRVTTEAEVEWIDGVKEIIPVPTDTKLVVEKPVHPFLARVMGLPNDSVSFNQLLLGTMAKHMVDNKHQIIGSEILDLFQIRSTLPNEKWPKEFKQVSVAGKTFVAGPTNKLAMNTIGLLSDSQTLSALPLAKLREILKLKQGGQLTAPTNAKPEEKLVWKMDAKKIDAYLKGEIEDPDFYQELILALPTK
jgi:hypothetical protein